MPAATAELHQALGAVAAHAGEHGRGALLGPVIGDALEKHVDARPEKYLSGLLAVFKRAGPGEHHVVIRAGEQHVAGERLLALFDHANRAAGAIAQPLGQAGGEGDVHVLHHDHRHVPVLRQRKQEIRNRLRSACRSTDDEEPRRCRRRDRSASSARIGCDADEFGDRADLFHQSAGPGDLAGRAEHRGVDRVERAVAHGVVDE